MGLPMFSPSIKQILHYFKPVTSNGSDAAVKAKSPRHWGLPMIALFLFMCILTGLATMLNVPVTFMEVNSSSRSDGSQHHRNIKFHFKKAHYSNFNQCPPEFELSEEISNRHSTLEQISPYNAKGEPFGEFNDTILVLSPVMNAEQYLLGFFQLLCSLSYPHNLISVAIGESSSKDNTYGYALQLAQRLRPFFKEINVYHFEKNVTTNTHFLRHMRSLQLQRRARIAEARNDLVQRALKDEKWVMWVDIDIEYFSPDIVQHLLSTHQPIIVPSCVQRLLYHWYRIYDCNTWRETEASLNYLKDKPDDFLMVEGSLFTNRIFLRDIRNEGLVVTLDGVGGCVLMIEAEKHRQGLLFPNYIFDHHIETEGLAKLATSKGIPVRGLPFVNVVHSGSGLSL